MSDKKLGLVFFRCSEAWPSVSQVDLQRSQNIWKSIGVFQLQTPKSYKPHHQIALNRHRYVTDPTASGTGAKGTGWIYGNLSSKAAAV